MAKKNVYWNVLLRLDRPEGPMPPPFEKPSEHHDFLVFEIFIPPQDPQPLGTVEAQLLRVRELVRAEIKPVLFIGTDMQAQPLVLPSSLIALLAEMGCGLEFSC